MMVSQKQHSGVNIHPWYHVLTPSTAVTVYQRGKMLQGY